MRRGRNGDGDGEETTVVMCANRETGPRPSKADVDRQTSPTQRDVRVRARGKGSVLGKGVKETEEKKSLGNVMGHWGKRLHF